MTTQEFEHIAQMLRPRLADVGRRFFGDDDRAEDVAQETLVRLWIVRERIGEGGDIGALAMRMARNICVDTWRKEQQMPTVGLDREAETAGTEAPLEEQEMQRQLQRAIEQLTPTERRLFRMRHELEMDIGQIAAVTAIGSRSVSAMLSVARKKIYETLRKEGTI